MGRLLRYCSALSTSALAEQNRYQDRMPPPLLLQSQCSANCMGSSCSTFRTFHFTAHYPFCVSARAPCVRPYPRTGHFSLFVAGPHSRCYPFAFLRISAVLLHVIFSMMRDISLFSCTAHIRAGTPVNAFQITLPAILLVLRITIAYSAWHSVSLCCTASA